jgi:hypothetical protein
MMHHPHSLTILGDEVEPDSNAGKLDLLYL